jgi:hypothetical protein
VLHDFFMAQMVQGSVTRGAKQVTVERGVDGERFTTSPNLEHDILRNFFGRRALAEHALGKLDEARVIRVEDGVEGSLITPPQTLEQLMVGQAAWRSSAG